MSPAATPSRPEPDARDLEGCPHCAAQDSRVTLLTTMVTYFVCVACARRWQMTTPVTLPAGETP